LPQFNEGAAGQVEVEQAHVAAMYALLDERSADVRAQGDVAVDVRSHDGEDQVPELAARLRRSRSRDLHPDRLPCFGCGEEHAEEGSKSHFGSAGCPGGRTAPGTERAGAGSGKDHVMPHESVVP
jgi:hypothetical protein